MDCFFVDKLGDDDNENREGGAEIAGEEEEDPYLNAQEIEFFDELPLNISDKKRKKERKGDFDLTDTYLITNYKTLSEERKELYANVDRFLQKSVLKPGLEKQHVVLPEKSRKLLKLERKKQNKKNKGKQWFDMPAAELTKEVTTDFKLLKMRSALDRKHVYKKNDMTSMPKYFQIGKVIESPADFYSSRIPKQQRKKTFVEELLADAEFKKYQKKKFKEIMDENRRTKRSVKKKLDKKSYKKSKTKNLHN